MNNPLPLEIGKQFASKLHAMTQNDAERFAIATKSLLGRLPKQSECNSLAQVLAKGSIPASTAPESDIKTPSLSGMNSSVEQWIRVCRSLLLTNEFFYVE
jgi:negative regulator of replication initiation